MDLKEWLDAPDRTVCLDCWEERYPGESVPDCIEVKTCRYHVRAHKDDEADGRNDEALLESVFGDAYGRTT